MTDTPNITEEITESKGRFVIKTDAGEAEMTFSIASPSLRIVDHTGVPEEMKGHGYGLALAEHLVSDARSKGYKVVPLCPFVNRMRARHPDWADVFQT